MRNFIFIGYFFFAFGWVIGQELNAVVEVNSEQVSQTNQTQFKTLERDLNDFINKTRWTNKIYDKQERVNCRILLRITSQDNNRYGATLQIQSSRPVYNASYETPIFNHNDEQFDFEYIEFQPLFFNPNNFESNLVSTIAYYIYIILGLDADSFALEGGTEYYEKAREVVIISQNKDYVGWNLNDSNRNRFILVDNLLSNTFKEFRILMYDYHRKGMDNMIGKTLFAKKNISSSIQLFEPMVKRRPNTFLAQTFFDAKSDEIRKIFSSGPRIDTRKLIEVLQKVAPFYNNVWKEIKY